MKITVKMQMICALILCSIGAFAAVIDEIEVKTDDDTPVPYALVAANMVSQVGDQFSPEVLSEDLRRLYMTGKFEDVRTGVDQLPENKVKITVWVKPKRLVREIVVEGNRQLSRNKSEAEIEHPTEVPLDETQLALDANAIRDLYRQAGFHDVTVDAIAQDIPNTNNVNLLFRIYEGERHKVRGIDFTGNTLFSDRQLRRIVNTKHSWLSRIFSTGYFSENQLHADIDALTVLYKNAGYLDFEVTDVQRQFNKDRTWVQITLELHEGEPYEVTSVEISGNQRFSTAELKKLVDLENKTYGTEAEREDLRRIRTKYEALGYLDLRTFVERDINSEERTVDLQYRISEGTPADIRDIHIVGNNVTKDRVIRRELALHPGDVADAGKIRVSESRLRNLNYFETVEITPAATEQEDEKDLYVNVEEKRTGQLMLGAGISSEDAAVAFLEVTQSNFDWKNWPGFRGGGQRLRLRTQLGTERSDFVVSFTEPWWLGRELRLDLDAYNHSRDEDEYTRESLGIGASLTKRWRKNWRRTLGLRIQQIELKDFDAGLSNKLLDEEGSYTANSIVLRLSRDTRNRFLNPSTGSRLSISSELLTEAIGSYSNVIKVEVSGQKYFPMVRGSTLKVGGEIAVSEKISGDKVAIFDRYFAGGAYSIRGFERREISPVDVNEDPLGGKSMLIGTVEIIMPFTRTVMGSIFCDAGNVWSEIDDLNPGEMNVSVGVGIQLNLPIGPVRVDYGWPIVTELDHVDDGGRLHFNLGYSF